MNPEAAIEFLESWGYPAFTILLTATGFGSPIPEDLLLLAGGYLISAGVFSWPVAFPLAFAGVTGSDSILWAVGRHMRTHTEKRTGLGLIATPYLDLGERWFSRYGEATVFFARLIPGTRFIVFITSGLHAVPYRRFILFDALGAALWTPFILWLGAHLGSEIGGIDVLIGRISRAVGWLVLALVGLAAWRIYQARRARRRNL